MNRTGKLARYSKEMENSTIDSPKPVWMSSALGRKWTGRTALLTLCNIRWSRDKARLVKSWSGSIMPRIMGDDPQDAGESK